MAKHIQQSLTFGKVCESSNYFLNSIKSNKFLSIRSIACTIIEMITLKRPFRGKSEHDVYKSIRSGPIPLLESSLELEPLIERQVE